MSSSLYTIMAQSNTGSDWNWFLIFIIFVVILAIALIVQAAFTRKDTDEFEFHEEEAHHEAESPAEEATRAAVVALEPAPEPEPEPKPEPALPVQPDDLKKIEGIGPKVASLLIENGIATFAQLAETPVEKLEEILDANRLQMMHPGSWPRQAKLAADGDWEAFQKLTEELHGGHE